MADEADFANDPQEQLLALQLQVRQPEGPAPTGYCLNCGEKLAPGARWCDVDCRNDYTLRTVLRP